ncbi:cell division protein FtsQ/DivIB [Arthrobacter sp. SA17]
MALLKQGETFQLVDIEGVQLSSTTDPSSIQLPVIDGGRGAMGKDLFHAITGVLGALPAEVLTKLSDASAKSVDAVELKLVDGQTIVWGNAGRRNSKRRCWRRCSRRRLTRRTPSASTTSASPDTP